MTTLQSKSHKNEKVKGEIKVVKNTKLRKQRHKKLSKGKGRKVGLIESIGLKITGRKDGRKGFPRLAENNEWYSTFMNRERNSFAEFCSHTWGSLQVENETLFAKLEQLMDEYRQKNKDLEELRQNLEVFLQTKLESESLRKKGEEKLTQEQVKARRKSENARILSPLTSKIDQLEQEIRENEENFSKLHSRLVEDDNSTRLICNRVRDHILSRVDVYWNSALMNHPESKDMPVAPALVLSDAAEDAYARPHKRLMERAAAIHEEIQDQVRMKEVM